MSCATDYSCGIGYSFVRYSCLRVPWYRRARSPSSRVRCSQPWPRPTTSHVPFPTEERRWHPQRSLLHRSRLQRPPGSRLLHKLHAAACAVLCGGTPRACHPVSVFVASERIRAARQHGMRTASAVAACSQTAPHPLPARPLARSAHPAPHPHRDTSPMGVAASCRCARTRLQLHAAPVARVPYAQAMACSFCYGALCGAHP